MTSIQEAVRFLENDNHFQVQKNDRFYMGKYSLFAFIHYCFLLSCEALKSAILSLNQNIRWQKKLVARYLAGRA